MSQRRSILVPDEQKSQTIILCKEHGEIQLTLEQHAVFAGSSELGGLCPICRHIPRQIRRLVAQTDDQ